MAESYSSQAMAGQHPAPQSTDNCPDPGPRYVYYSVEADVARKKAALYDSDRSIIDDKYSKLAGAQDRYAKAKNEQQAAYKDLQKHLHQIGEMLTCALQQEARDRLCECWKEALAGTGLDTSSAQCVNIDKLDCCNLPWDIAQLRGLEAPAADCVKQADTDFDNLAGLPEKLGGLISKLTADANNLEQEVSASGADLERGFVEYLKLKRDVGMLKEDWTTPADYGCKLKLAFATLLHRHTAVICIKAAIHRWEQYTKLEDEAKQAKANNLIDLVLECARPKPSPPSQPCPPAGGTPQPCPPPPPPSQPCPPAGGTGQPPPPQPCPPPVPPSQPCPPPAPPSQPCPPAGGTGQPPPPQPCPPAGGTGQPGQSYYPPSEQGQQYGTY